MKQNGKAWVRKFNIYLLFAILLVCTGCGVPAKQEGKAVYSFTDITGTTIEMTGPPQRIVSLGLNDDELLLDLVAPERIAALTTTADDAGISAVADKAKLVKGRVQTANVESVLQCQPDLVLMPDWLNVVILKQVRATGVKVYVHNTPKTMEEIKAVVADISKVVGEEEKGRLLVAQMDKRLQAVKTKTNAIPPEKRKKLLALSFMGPMGIKGSSFDDMCKYANIINGIAGLDIPANSTFSEEQMLVINPDIILIPSWDYGGTRNTGEFKASVLNNPAYQGIKAIKNKDIIQLQDKYLYSTSHYAVQAVEDLAKATYPEYMQ